MVYSLFSVSLHWFEQAFQPCCYAKHRVNLSWDLLPCHLQNGADITNYIIQYTCWTTNVTTRISSSSGSTKEYFQEFGGLYSCVVATLLIPSDQAFSIQVAAQSDNGKGSFSDPINMSTPVSSRYLMCSCLNYIIW